MLAEIAQTGVANVSDLKIGDYPDSAEYEIEEYEAWLNYKGDHDWKIVELEVK